MLQYQFVGDALRLYWFMFHWPLLLNKKRRITFFFIVKKKELSSVDLNTSRCLVPGDWAGKSGWMEWRSRNSPTFSRLFLLSFEGYDFR